MVNNWVKHYSEGDVVSLSTSADLVELRPTPADAENNTVIRVRRLPEAVKETLGSSVLADVKITKMVQTSAQGDILGRAGIVEDAGQLEKPGVQQERLTVKLTREDGTPIIAEGSFSGPWAFGKVVGAEKAASLRASALYVMRADSTTLKLVPDVDSLFLSRGDRLFSGGDGDGRPREEPWKPLERYQLSSVDYDVSVISSAKHKTPATVLSSAHANGQLWIQREGEGEPKKTMDQEFRAIFVQEGDTLSYGARLARPSWCPTRSSTRTSAT